jgi:Arv1-like family
MICVECGRPVATTYVRYSGPSGVSGAPVGGGKQAGEKKTKKRKTTTTTDEDEEGDSGGAKSQRGDTIRLSRCEHCHEVADRYIEYDFVLCFLDLVLAKVSVYRHFLFNSLPYTERGIAPRYWKIAALYLFFDCYAKFSHCHYDGTRSGAFASLGNLSAAYTAAEAPEITSSVDSSAIFGDRAPPHAAAAALHPDFPNNPHDRTQLSQDALFLSLAEGVTPDGVSPLAVASAIFVVLSTLLEFFAFIAGTVSATKYFMSVRVNSRAPSGNTYSVIQWNYVVMGLLLSSFGKSFLFLVMIWDYDTSYGLVVLLVNAFCYMSNVLALRVVVECSAIQAGVYVFCGVIAQLLTTLILYLSTGQTGEALCELGLS